MLDKYTLYFFIGEIREYLVDLAHKHPKIIDSKYHNIIADIDAVLSDKERG